MIGRLTFALAVSLTSASIAAESSCPVDALSKAGCNSNLFTEVGGRIAPDRTEAPPLLLADMQSSGPSQDDTPQEPPHDATPVLWHATAYGLWKDKRGLAHVAVGYSGTADSADGASANAIQSCRQAGGGNTCKVIGPFSSGCVYITSGSSTRGVSYGNAATPEDAFKSCRTQGKGYKCQKPIGGCLQ